MISLKSLQKYAIIISVSLLALGFSTTFAQNITTATNICDTKELSTQLADLLTWVLAMLSWLRIPIAIFAGKLMNNGFIYGEFFNLDKVLYFLRNISRTFANFLVIALIIGELIKQFWSGGINQWKMMKYILKLWWWIFLANLSRFLIWATVDISTILTTTVWSLPSTYIAQNNTSKDIMLNAIKAAKLQSKQTIKLNTKQCDTYPTVEFSNKNTTQQLEKSEQEIMDMILPTENSVSGPLMYLWIGVLKIQDYLNTTNIPNGDVMYILFVIGTRIGITILFIIALIVLVIINIFRIVAIWFFVAFAPLLILLQVADKEKSYQTGLLTKFSIQNIIKSIFAPVIAVWLMSIGLIVVVVMQWFLQNTENIQLDDVGMSINPNTKTSSIGVNGIFETTMAWDILWKDDGNLVKNTFSNILLIIFTLFILYGVVQALSSFLKDGIWWEIISKAVDLWWQALSMIPVPLPWWGTASIGSVGRTIDRRIDTMSRTLDNKWRDQDTAIENQIRKSMWLKTNLYSDSYKWLTKLTKSFEWKTTLGEEDYNKIISEYHKSWIIEHYKWENTTLSAIDSTNTLQNFFKWVAWKRLVIWNNTYTFSTWKKEDWTDHNIESFITKNYKDNKTFFNKVYKDMWWDINKLTDWSSFWNKPFKRW